MVVNDSEKSPKVASKFYCECCDYNTCKKSDFAKHLTTDKHKNNENGSKMVVNGSEKSPKVAQYVCECGKIYKYDSGYYRHKKNCNGVNITMTTDEPIDKELIMMLLKQNSQLIQQNADLVKNSSITTTNSHNNTNTNSHNKTFNLQFFLNETCKNAMNIKEFVDSIKLQLSDLESVGKIGYVEGLSKIIIKNLNALDVTERPVHCSDSKRDTMYVKDEDKWEKENENNEKVLQAIEDIANKNSKQVKEWKHKNPECASSKSFKADVYSHIMIEAVCSNNNANNNKVLKKLIKEVTIDKSKL
jgi:hypothetical protein